MEKIEITRDMMEQAADYVSNAEKERWVGDTAPKCFDRLAITADGEAMPPMYIVNAGLRSRYLMGAFAKLYMKTTFSAEERDESLMTEEVYDAWAGSHVFCQIDRMKKDADLRDKCYDMMADFKDLEKRLSAQLNGLLAVQNDSVLRNSQYMAAQMKELPVLLEQMKKLQGKAENDAEKDSTPN